MLLNYLFFLICLPFKVISKRLSWMNILGFCVFIKTFRKHLLRIQGSVISLEKNPLKSLFFIWGLGSDVVLAWARWCRPGQGWWSSRRWQDHLLPPGLDGRHQLFLHVAGLGSCPTENSQCYSCWHPVSLHTSQETAREKGKTNWCSSFASPDLAH